VKIHKSAYDAARDADAVVVVTEWEEFKQLDYGKIFNAMHKPAFIFDGRLILNHAELKKLGFRVEAIGKAI
jgi:UDPglucose 6-dehydrogenase